MNLLTCAKLTPLLLLLSCSPSAGGSGENGGEQDSPLAQQRRDVLRDIGEHVILPSLADFKTHSQALQSAASAWSAGPAPQQVQDAFKRAMLSWQRVEVYQLGPAGIMGEAAGGKDRRDAIYSWTLVNPCRVDQELVEKGYEGSGFADELINVRGLDALEHLIYSAGTENACKPTSTINKDGSWAALSQEELNTRRAAYTRVLASSLAGDAAQLEQDWSSEGGDFLKEFSRAGTAESATYATSQEALNALSDALFYVEKETKDMKLAIPAGISDCDTDTCPEALELAASNLSKEAAIANVEALRDAYLGHRQGEPAQQGFDDLLTALGESALDAQMQERIEAALTALRAIPGPLEQALSEDPASVEAAYLAAKALGDLLKTQFIGALDLELPQRAEGDND